VTDIHISPCSSLSHHNCTLTDFTDESIEFCASQRDSHGNRLYKDPRLLHVRPDSEGRLGFTMAGGLTGAGVPQHKRGLFVIKVCRPPPPPPPPLPFCCDACYRMHTLANGLGALTGEHI
jgi:hypothetical protein